MGIVDFDDSRMGEFLLIPEWNGSNECQILCNLTTAVAKLVNRRTTTLMRLR